MIEAPQGFIVAEECRKAASQNGYRRDMGEEDGWARYGSTTAKGTVYLAASRFGRSVVFGVGPSRCRRGSRAIHQATWLALGLRAMSSPSSVISTQMLPKVYAFGLTLPEGPLEDFRAKTFDLPKNTESERMVIQRVGQDIFRDCVMTYWRGPLPLDRDHGHGPSPRLPHHSVERLPRTTQSG